MKSINGFRDACAILMAYFAMAISVTAQQGDTVKLRFSTYNLDSLQEPASSDQYTALLRIGRSLHSDVLIVQGVADTVALQFLWLLSNAIDSSKLAPYFGSGHSALMYNSKRVQLLNYNIVPTSHLPIDEWILYVPSTNDTIVVVSCQFVSGSDPVSTNERTEQAHTLRAYLHQRRNLKTVVAGTFNFGSSNDDGYRWLADDAPFGDTLLHNPLKDPVNLEGNWHHNSAFPVARRQTYSTRLDSALDTSGLVDRFDMVLLSTDLMAASYLDSSYRAYGNSGTQFGKSVTLNGQRQTSPYPELQIVSTHLPVFVDLIFKMKTTGVQTPKSLPTEMDLSGIDRKSIKGIPLQERLFIDPFPSMGQP